LKLLLRWRPEGLGFYAQARLEGSVERNPIKWNHLNGKDSLKIKELEHVLIEKVGQLFWNLL